MTTEAQHPDHLWRWRKRPDAAELEDTFSDVVRTVGVLHKRGVFHRDLKADNILIRREDGRPFLIDFGTVRLPGALTRTLGLPEGVLHLAPPELLAYVRTEAWKREVPFEGGAPADLYTLGVLLYQSLTDKTCWVPSACSPGEPRSRAHSRRQKRPPLPREEPPCPTRPNPRIPPPPPVPPRSRPSSPPGCVPPPVWAAPRLR